MICDVKALYETVMMIEVFYCLGFIYLVANAKGILFSVKSKSIHNWKQELVIWTEIFHWNFKELELLRYINSFIFTSFSILSVHKSLNFGCLSLELHNVPIFRRGCDTSGTLSLYSARIYLKLEKPALEKNIFLVQNWYLQLESFCSSKINPFPVPFLCNLTHIRLYFIQISMKITCK